VIAIDDEEVRAMYEDTVWWSERNNPEKYADTIEFLLNPKNQNEITAKNIYILNRLLDIDRSGCGKLYANTQERAAKQYEAIFMAK